MWMFLDSVHGKCNYSYWTAGQCTGSSGNATTCNWRVSTRNGDMVSAMNFTNWGNRQPSHKPCTVYNAYGWFGYHHYWFNDDCEDRRCFVCEIDIWAHTQINICNSSEQHCEHYCESVTCTLTFVYNNHNTCIAINTIKQLSLTTDTDVVLWCVRRRARRWGAHGGGEGAGAYRVATRTACYHTA